VVLENGALIEAVSLFLTISSMKSASRHLALRAQVLLERSFFHYISITFVFIHIHLTMAQTTVSSCLAACCAPTCKNFDCTTISLVNNVANDTQVCTSDIADCAATCCSLPPGTEFCSAVQCEVLGGTARPNTSNIPCSDPTDCAIKCCQATPV
jgi:hypothetical protein